MKLFKVTLTGIDEKTDLREVAKLSKEYPFVEWGVLFSKTKCGLENRYPSIKKIDEFSKIPETNKSLHICGSLARNYWTSGNYNTPHVILGELFGNVYGSYFSRFQYNISNISTEDLVIRTGMGDVIIQFSNKSWLTKISNSPMLYDCSGGMGKEIEINLSSDEILSINNRNITLGLAGGLGPDNTVRILNKFVNTYEEHFNKLKPFWIDMESKVRTDDWLDLDKCEEVLYDIDNWLKIKAINKNSETKKS